MVPTSRAKRDSRDRPQPARRRSIVRWGVRRAGAGWVGSFACGRSAGECSRRNSGEKHTTYAASRINQLRKSSSAASQTAQFNYFHRGASPATIRVHFLFRSLKFSLKTRAKARPQGRCPLPRCRPFLALLPHSFERLPDLRSFGVHLVTGALAHKSFRSCSHEARRWHRRRRRDR